MIPEQLKKPEFRFVLLKAKDKIPFEKDWTNKGYTFDNPRLIQHIKSGGNYGVIGGYGNLRMLDIDDLDRVEEFEKKLGNTFMVKTGSGGLHFYFISEYDVNNVLTNGLGEFRAKNYQCVGAGCTHPNGKKYEVLGDEPILEIPKEVMQEMLKPFLKKTEGVDLIKEWEKHKASKNTDDTSRSGFEIKKVISLIRKGKIKTEIFQEMNLFAKWSSAPEQYKELTYNKAVAWCEAQKQEKEYVGDDIGKKVISLLLQKERHKATELIATNIIQNNNIYTTRHDKQSEMWIYKEGIYLPKGRSYAKEVIRKYTQEAFTTHLCNEVINKIEADTFIEQEELFKEENNNEICLENGILNVETLEIKEFTPEKKFFSKFPIKYNSKNKCPKINKFFKDILNEDEKVDLIKEIFGRLLIKEYKPKRAVMFFNTGDGAKSTIQNLIRKFIGIDNTSSISLSRMNDVNFSLDELHKKQVNLSGEISNTDLKDSSTFKSITGGDEVSAKRKFLSDLKFINYALLIFACNDLPKVYDTSLGFWGRWILIEFPNFFLKEDEYKDSNSPNKRKANEEILKEICTEEELSGLLNEALIGLKRLKQNKDFTYTKNSKEVMETWMRTADSFLAYCTDNIIEMGVNEIKKTELRRRYRQYCKKHKVKSVSDISIKITLQEMFGASDDRTWNNDDKKQDNVWVGVQFKEDLEEVDKISKLR
jgi:putative DNA primase/helicase